jgi:hypothetical protein
MKKIILGLGALLTLGLFADSALAQRGRGRGRGRGLAASRRWFSDYREARAEAARTGKPMMLVFRCVP